MPPGLTVFLIPAEKESAGDLLRYRWFVTRDDGAFTVGNLAPGRYWVLTKEGINRNEPGPPPFWDAESRALLRKAAEAENVVVELAACQRVKDFTLRHKTTTSPVKPGTVR